MKKKTVLTTLVALLLLAAVIAAGMNAVFTVAYVHAEFQTYTAAGAEAARSLKEELNVYLGESTTFLNLEEVRASVEKYPRFRSVEVKKSYPSAIELRIVERREAFVVADGESYLLLDEEGYVLDHADSADTYIELRSFDLFFADGWAGGEYFDEWMQAFCAVRGALGEPRANILSAELIDRGSDALASFDRFRICMREGVVIELVNPRDRAAEKAEKAIAEYLRLKDLQRVRGTITVTDTVSGSIVVDYDPDISA